ncbi:unnamed protein product [Caenorhabditis sp. 36 PRJEB53466]|nr:unnamed protein product [Caenorhabditis sp. 36 PRJEB53466]
MRLWLAFLIPALVVDQAASQSSDATTSTVTSGSSATTTYSSDSTVDPSASTVDPSASTADPSASTAVPSVSTADPTASTSSSAVTDASNSTGSTVEGDNSTTIVGSTTPEGPHADCYLCAPTVQCGETIEGDYSSAEVNVLFMKAMEDGDYFTVKGEVFENAQQIFFDVFKDLSVGKAQVGGNSQPTLVQFEHFYDTNLTFSRSGLQGDVEQMGLVPSGHPSASNPTKKPWTLMFKMHQNLTGFETGDETGWFNNHIPWNGTATTQSFNIRGGWKTTSVTYTCVNSSIPIL